MALDNVLGLLGLILFAVAAVGCVCGLMQPSGTDAFHREHVLQADFDLEGIVVFGAMAANSGLLLRAGKLLKLRHRHADSLHAVYCIAQLVLSVALAGMCMVQIYNSPAGMLFYLGAIPGLITAIPALLIGVLTPSAIVSDASCVS